MHQSELERLARVEALHEASPARFAMTPSQRIVLDATRAASRAARHPA